MLASRAKFAAGESGFTGRTKRWKEKDEESESPLSIPGARAIPINHRNQRELAG